MTLRQDELEHELEGEGEGKFEFEFEFEALGSADGLREYEWESEFEGEGEFEFEFEALGSADGLREYEWESEFEGEEEFEFEGEEFLGRIARMVRRNLPAIRNVLRHAAPLVGTAVGGPLGGIIGRAAGAALREEELEEELEGEGEFEDEAELEAVTTSLATPAQASAELMAAVASTAATEAEAEAMIGAATVISLTPAERQALRRLVPHLVRGSAVLTRMLRQNPRTRLAVRSVPAIIRRTSSVLVRQAAAGQPVTCRTAGRVMAAQTRRVLSNPRTATAAIGTNVRAARAARPRSSGPTVTRKAAVRAAATRPAGRPSRRPTRPV